MEVRKRSAAIVRQLPGKSPTTRPLPRSQTVETGRQASAGTERSRPLSGQPGTGSRGKRGTVVWHRPRFEAAGKTPLLLTTIAQYGPAYEVEYSSRVRRRGQISRCRGGSGQRSKAVGRLTSPGSTASTPAFLKRWIEVLAIATVAQGPDDAPGRIVPAGPAANCWTRRLRRMTRGRPSTAGGARGPTCRCSSRNSSDKTRANSRQDTARTRSPSTRRRKEFVAVAWKSPDRRQGARRRPGNPRSSRPAATASPGGSNTAKKASVGAGGRPLDLGGAVKSQARDLAGRQGRSIDPGSGSTRRQPQLRPDGDRPHHHRDRQAEARPGTWPPTSPTPSRRQSARRQARQQRGLELCPRPVQDCGDGPRFRLVPADSVLGRWREAAADPARLAEAGKAGRASADAAVRSAARQGKGPRPHPLRHPRVARRPCAQGNRTDAASPNHDRKARATASPRSASAGTPTASRPRQPAWSSRPNSHRGSLARGPVPRPGVRGRRQARRSRGDASCSSRY